MSKKVFESKKKQEGFCDRRHRPGMVAHDNCKVIMVYPGTRFLVKTEEGVDIECNSICGKMYQAKIRVSLGDTVDIETSPYSPDRNGQIVWRHNK